MDAKRTRFATEVLPHLDAAYRYALRLTRSAADAQDLAQEAMLRAYRSFETLRGTHAKPWLLTIVRNCYFTTRAQQQRQVEVPLPGEHDAHTEPALRATTPDPEGASIVQDEQRALGRVLSTLSQEHREVLTLKEIEDLSYREIASITNVPIGTVMSRLARARIALKERWIAEHGESRDLQ
jgi:RNA polymerase sigma-70 factor, ECF subfamily